jgi:excisionase family DNA binding protein
VEEQLNDYQTEGKNAPASLDIPSTETAVRQSSNHEDTIMTPGETALYLRISVATLQKLSRRNEIPGFYIGRLWRYRKSQLDEYSRSRVSSFRHPCRK